MFFFRFIKGLANFTRVLISVFSLVKESIADEVEIICKSNDNRYTECGEYDDDHEWLYVGVSDPLNLYTSLRKIYTSQ